MKILALEKRVQSPLGASLRAQRIHHECPKEFAVTSKALHAEMRDYLRIQKQAVLNNPFGDAGGTDWGQAAKACQFLMPRARVQVVRKSRCKCNPWRRNN